MRPGRQLSSQNQVGRRPSSYVVVQRGYCAQCATALKFGGRTTEPDDGRGNSLLASASATSTSSLRLFGLFGPARRLAMGKGGSPRVEYPCSSRRSLPILIFMAVATALSALRMASLQPAPTAPHNVGDFLRQPSAPLKESDISLEFEDAFVRGSPEDEPPRVDSWLIKGHHLPEPTGRIPKRINKIFFQKDGNFRSQLYREKDGISDLIKAAHQSWTDKNPGYKVHYYNIPAARKYPCKPSITPSFCGCSIASRPLRASQISSGWHCSIVRVVGRRIGSRFAWKMGCLMP